MDVNSNLSAVSATIRPIESSQQHYDAVYDVWKSRSKHLETTKSWIRNSLPTHVKELGLSHGDRPINSLSIGSGAGELESEILEVLLKTFSNINHHAIEPSAQLHGQYTDLIIGKPKFQDIQFTWQHQTFDCFRRLNLESDMKFDFINAFDSLYYVDDLDVALDYLYQKCLASGGVLVVRLISDHVGFGPLWNAFPHLFAKAQITSAAVRDYCERHDLQSTIYQSETRGTDITGCFDKEPSREDALMLDFFTHTVNFTNDAPSKLKQDILEFLGSCKCSEAIGNEKRHFVSGAEYIIIENIKKTNLCGED